MVPSQKGFPDGPASFHVADLDAVIDHSERHHYSLFLTGMAHVPGITREDHRDAARFIRLFSDLGSSRTGCRIDLVEVTLELNCIRIRGQVWADLNPLLNRLVVAGIVTASVVGTIGGVTEFLANYPDAKPGLMELIDDLKSLTPDLKKHFHSPTERVVISCKITPVDPLRVDLEPRQDSCDDDRPKLHP